MKKRKRGVMNLLTAALLIIFCVGCGDRGEANVGSAVNSDGERYISLVLATDLSLQGHTAQEAIKRSAKEFTPSIDKETTPIPVSYSYSGTVFEYNGITYEMKERYDGITAIMDCFEKGEYIIIEGHTGPHNGIYSIFNTKTKEFETDLFGYNLMFCGADIYTAVYGFWNNICLYDGTILASFDLKPTEIIREIVFNGEEKRLEVEIQVDDNKTNIEYIDVSENKELFR